MELRDLLCDFPHLQPLAGRWSVCRLATLSDLSTAELGSLLLRELGLASLEDCVLQEFEQLIAQASDLAASRWARSARVQSSVEWASAAAKFRRVDASLPLAAGSVCLLTAWAPVVGNKQKRLRQGHWPTRSHGAASLSAVDQSRQAGEDKQRRRWLAQLQRLIATSGLPAAEAGISGRVGKGRRASTLRKHVKTWERVVAWVRSAFGVSWPSADHFAAYLQARASEPCGRSVPGSCLKTLMFMESAGEVSLDSKISRCPVIRNTMEELALALGNQDLRGRRQANQLLGSQVKAFEGLVMNEQAPRYVRAFAWFKLVKLWGCLRYSDTEGMPARAVVVDERGLSARLERTKTKVQARRLRCFMLMFLLQLGWWNHAGSEWVGSFGKPWVMRQLLLRVISSCCGQQLAFRAALPEWRGITMLRPFLKRCSENSGLTVWMVGSLWRLGWEFFGVSIPSVLPCAVGLLAVALESWRANS